MEINENMSWEEKYNLRQLKKKEEADLTRWRLMEESRKVYFIHDGAFFKIGCSVDPEERLKQIRSHRPNAFLGKVIPGGFKLERELQKQYEKQRIGGEWFMESSNKGLGLEEY